MALVYLDSSAIVKLAIEEPESAALRRTLRGRTELVSSALARTEVARTLLPEGRAAVERGEAVLERIELARVNDRVLRLAGELTPHGLRSIARRDPPRDGEAARAREAGRHLRRAHG